MSSNPPPMHALRGPSTNNPLGRPNHHRPPRHRHRSPIRHGARHPAPTVATSDVANDPVCRDGITESVPGPANTSSSLNSEGMPGAPFEPEGYELFLTSGPPDVRRRRSKLDNRTSRLDTGTFLQSYANPAESASAANFSETSLAVEAYSNQGQPPGASGQSYCSAHLLQPHWPAPLSSTPSTRELPLLAHHPSPARRVSPPPPLARRCLPSDSSLAPLPTPMSCSQTTLSSRLAHAMQCAPS
jgi:hypothetical protein